MANPFSAVPMSYRVHTDGRWWYANGPGMHSGSAPPCMSTGISRHPARTAESRSRSSRCTGDLMMTICSFAASYTQRNGGRCQRSV